MKILTTKLRHFNSQELLGARCCIRHVLRYSNITADLEAYNNTHLLYHSYRGSGFQAWLSWVLCFSASHRAMTGSYLRLDCGRICL